MQEVQMTRIKYPISIRNQSFGYSYHLQGYSRYTNSFLPFLYYLLQCMAVQQAQKTIASKKGICAELLIFGAHYILPLCQNNQQKCKEEMFGNEETQKLDLETIMKKIMEKKSVNAYLITFIRLLEKNIWPYFESILSKIVFKTKNQRYQKLTMLAKKNIIPIKIIPQLQHIEVFRNDKVDPTKQLITLQKFMSRNVTSTVILSTIIKIAQKLILYQQTINQPYPWVTKQSIQINQNSNDVQLSIQTILLCNVSGFFHYSLLDYLLKEKKVQPYKPPKLSDRNDRISAEFIILLFYLESKGQISLSLDQLEEVKLNSDTMRKTSSFTITTILKKMFAKQVSLNLEQIAKKIKIKDIYQYLKESNHNNSLSKEKQEKIVPNIPAPPKIKIIKKGKQPLKINEQSRDLQSQAKNRNLEVEPKNRGLEVKKKNEDLEIKQRGRNQEIKQKNREQEVKQQSKGQEIKQLEVKQKNRHLVVKSKNVMKSKLWQNENQQNERIPKTPINSESYPKYDAYKNIEYYWAQTLAKNEGSISKDMNLKLAVYSIKFYMCLITYIFHFKNKPQNRENQKLKVLKDFQEKVKKYIQQRQQKKAIRAIQNILKIKQQQYTEYDRENKNELIRCIYDILKSEFPPCDQTDQTTYFLYDKKVKFSEYKQNDFQVLLLAQVFMKAQENNKIFLEQVLLREYRYSKTKEITINQNIIEFIRNEKYAFQPSNK